MSKVARIRMFAEYLREEGYVPNIDGDGDIVFKREGRTYFVMLSDDDDVFYRIVFPAFWSIDSAQERLACEHAAVVATADTKVAKVFPVENSMWASIELFCPSLDAAIAVFPRSMDALQAAVRRFVDTMRG